MSLYVHFTPLRDGGNSGDVGDSDEGGSNRCKPAVVQMSCCLPGVSGAILQNGRLQVRHKAHQGISG